MTRRHGSVQALRVARARGRAGTAMVEFVMTIPLIALIIGLTFLFGWSLTNKQHLSVSDRYLAWRQVRAGGAPGAQGINEAFFDGRAGHVDIRFSPGPDEAVHEWIDAADENNRAAGQLAHIFMTEHCPLPFSRRVTVSADFPPPVAAWEKFEGDLYSRHLREGLEWRRAHHAACEEPLREQFLGPLDAALGGIRRPGDGLAATFRALYRVRW